ncbi:MAG: hypothetical protein JXB48_19680 [Candidatus Latescibacteria bacterium]|nr:hypothetical protein [Candidatus Latescibacterota bacterium]
MIEPMAKIEIVGLLDELDKTLDMLQNFGQVQIEEIPTVEETGKSFIHRIHLDEKKEKLLSGYEELLSIINDIFSVFGEHDTEEVPLDIKVQNELMSMNPEELNSRISKVSRDVRRLGRQQKNLLQDMESTLQYESLINTFLPLLEKAGHIEEHEQLGIVLKKEESSVLPVLKKRVEEITGPETLVLHQEMSDGSIGVFIVIHPDDLPVVRQLLSNEGVTEYHIPREFRKKNLQASIDTIRKRIEEIPVELKKIDQELLEAKIKNDGVLTFIRSLCTDRLNQIRILSRLVRTKHTFAISGWTPVSSLAILKRQFNDKFGNHVYIGTVNLSDLDFLHIPTKLTNRGVFRSFEVLMKLLPPPRYSNLDATPFITLFFPIFFGIILGDVAYGLLLLGIAAMIKWKSVKGSHVSDAGTVALISGLSTVLFGFLFGEFLGDIGEHFGMHPVAPWLHRSAAIEMMLIVALGIGVIHIMLGFALKVYISFIIKHTKGIIEGCAKIFIILGLVGIFIQLFVGFPVVVRYVSFVLMGIGFIGVSYTEGFVGLLEIFSMFGNILSYSRLMAIGIASVILAIVANRLAEAADNIIAAILIGLCIHLINFIMGVFSPTIHSLRLHYVEFFGKFYQASGKVFKPFKKIGRNLS